ncbi:hypothetical protein QBC43DRAFT_351141 [Cladorrhinum sp. PSN259]|nr:hypothetical protein QBC43DRAFT_351141 [Cladorrhinum sp. PSN259]
MLIKAKDPLEQLATVSPVKFDAELFAASIYKGEPRKELDEAWDKVVDHPMILVDNKTMQDFDSTTKPTKGVTQYLILRGINLIPSISSKSSNTAPKSNMLNNASYYDRFKSTINLTDFTAVILALEH